MLSRITLGLQKWPVFPGNLRAKMLKLAGLRVGRTVNVGEGVFIGATRVSIGRRTFINARCFLDASAQIDIGDDVHFAPNVQVYTSSHEVGPTERRGGPNSAAPVRIGNGCWIGAGAMVLPGVNVAEGCVVAAGAVVTQSTEPNGLYGGTPARRLRDLA